MFERYLLESPVIAILRGIVPSEVSDVCETLYQKGIRVLEITLNSPDACTSIQIAADQFGGKMCIGAGTVLTPQEVDAVSRAGGRFIISPDTNAEVIKRTKELGMISIPGFFTATEAFTAIRAGADYLKLFPASLGPGYVKDLSAVVKKPIMAVGGVNQDNIASFMKVCPGVGIGSALYKSGKSLEAIAADAEKLLSAIPR